ncbi:hypothetical protein [Thiocapsa marina]|uniref:hypothetical protein n=1 Tax=Thiocapsa marina TaxID=244573 RepID=UPI0002FD91B0|nr:hypothetical protein [Thiocapsa marina]
MRTPGRRAACPQARGSLPGRPARRNGQEAEDDDATEEDAAPSHVAEALDAWVARNLAAL